LSCEGCGASIRVDGIAIDVIPHRLPSGSWGARAMQSAWLAGIYDSWWRPAVFGLSTGLRMPSAEAETRLVLACLEHTQGPWLDVSCGPATLTRRLLAHADGRVVVGLDLSRAMLERARRRAPGALLVRADAAALPFADGAFGAVVNLAALDLYSDPAQVVAESARVLARGGRWVASTFVVRRRKALLQRFAGLTGVRTPTIDEIVAWVAGAGLGRLETAAFGRYVVAWADKR
jgi:ubiquinone/menaquinone biosynthesis C-methylase UbiE